jgi:antitoxin component of MazEF toxin-antitoxin module
VIGEKVDAEVKDGELILRPVHAGPEYSLDELLANCTRARIKLDKEDKAWLDDVSVGKEF